MRYVGTDRMDNLLLWKISDSSSEALFVSIEVKLENLMCFLQTDDAFIALLCLIVAVSLSRSFFHVLSERRTSAE